MNVESRTVLQQLLRGNKTPISFKNIEKRNIVEEPFLSLSLVLVTVLALSNCIATKEPQKYSNFLPLAKVTVKVTAS